MQASWWCVRVVTYGFPVSHMFPHQVCLSSIGGPTQRYFVYTRRRATTCWCVKFVCHCLLRSPIFTLFFFPLLTLLSFFPYSHSIVFFFSSAFPPIIFYTFLLYRQRISCLLPSYIFSAVCTSLPQSFGRPPCSKILFSTNFLRVSSRVTSNRIPLERPTVSPPGFYPVSFPSSL